jgi:hypothetical protein
VLRRTAVRFEETKSDITVMSEPTPGQPTQSLAMRLMTAGVPLSLLIDLTTADGPDSAAIYGRESPDLSGLHSPGPHSFYA